MLGYEMKDLNDMTDGLTTVLETIKTDPALYHHVWKARDLLEGLWAEGYFDQTNVSPIVQNKILNPTKGTKCPSMKQKYQKP